MLGEATFIQVVRDERPQLTAKMRDLLDTEARIFGIEVVDVRIRRADLPEQNSKAVYERMTTERQRQATGGALGGGTQKGAGDSCQSRSRRHRPGGRRPVTGRRHPWPGRFGAQPHLCRGVRARSEFFAFYRSMQAYEAGLKHSDTRMLIKPDSDFFRYFVDPSGKSRDDNKK